MKNFIKNIKTYISQNKSKTTLICFAILVAIFCQLVHINTGGKGELKGQPNRNNAPISYLEQNNQKISDAWERSIGAYAAIKAASKMPKMLEEAGIGGVKVGAILSPIAEQLDRISSVLFVAVMVLTAQKFLMGFTSFIAIKILIFWGIVAWLLGHFISPLKAIGRFFIQLGIITLLFVPTTAYINHQIETSSKLDDQLKELRSETADIDSEFQKSTALEGSDEEERETSEEGSWISSVYQGMKEMVSNPKEAIRALFVKLDKAMEQAMEITMIFILTTVVVPIGVAFVFWTILKSINVPQEIGDFRDKTIGRVQKKPKKETKESPPQDDLIYKEQEIRLDEEKSTKPANEIDVENQESKEKK